MTATRPRPSDRLDDYSEHHADAALHHMAMLRDHLVLERNERVAAEHVERAIMAMQDACGALLRDDPVGRDLALVSL